MKGRRVYTLEVQVDRARRFELGCRSEADEDTGS